MSSSSEDAETKTLIAKEESNTESTGNKTFMLFCCAVVVLGSVSVGLMLGITSPLIPDIQNDKHNTTPHLEPKEISWFGGVLTLGGVVGGFLAGYMMQSIGRKLTSIISAAPYIIGLTLITFASQKWMLYVGRIISGLGIGISSLIVPVYIGEITTSELRGMLGSSAQLWIVSGILIIYGLGIVLPWRWLAATATVFPVLLMFFSLFIVETPRYFVLKNQKLKAKNALKRLRGPNADIEEEYKELETSLDNEVEPATWMEIFKEKRFRTPLLISLGAMYFQQMSGINAVMFYAKSLFTEAGFVDTQLTTALLSTAGAQVLFTLVSCLIIDKTGRKVLLVIGGILMTLSLTTFGIYFYLQSLQTSTVNTTPAPYTLAPTNVSSSPLPPLQHRATNLTWMALASMVVFIASYSIGIGPIAWLLVGEILPLRARGKAAGLSTAFNLFLVFVITSSFSSMMNTLTPQGTFWFFAANCALSIFFTVFFLPETKGKSLEEIEMHFQS